MLSAIHKRRDPDALAASGRALVLALCAAIAGCQSQTVREQPGSEIGAAGAEDPAAPLAAEPDWREIAPVPLPPQDMWERVRDGFQLQDYVDANPRIEQQRLLLASSPASIRIASERGSLYLHYIVERLEERDMPLELALLPIIESAYNPFANSSSQAVGLWQFIPSTGQNFNLRQTSWYDGRRDITASTNAALSYLNHLHGMFNGDWLLALAAYNAGEGTVSRAIERNQKLGLPTDYWNLPLSRETRDYVPKLLALSQLVMTPEAYGISLCPIANEPYFEVVPLKQRVDLARLAAMADVEEEELYQLNPAFTRRITFDGPQQLLVPLEKAELLSTGLAQLKPQELVDWQQYRVRPGDTLSAIAGRHHLSVRALKELNQLKSNRLNIGQTLSIPAAAGQPSTQLLQAVAANKTQAPRTYRVRPGDNLWDIAKSQRVSVQDLQRWNSLAGSRLHVGQALFLQATGSPPEKRQAATYYRVKEGDSLYRIAQRFEVRLQSLQRWNPASSSALKPGQMLTLYLPR